MAEVPDRARLPMSGHPYRFQLVAIGVHYGAPAIAHGIHDGQVALISLIMECLLTVPRDLSLRRE